MNQFIVEIGKNKDAVVAIASMCALIVSVLSASLSFIGILYSKKMDSSIKREETIRKQLESEMIGIGEALHQILASADILVNRKWVATPDHKDLQYKQSVKNILSKLDDSSKVLRKTKIVYRYKVYGIEEGLLKLQKWPIG